jgi:hypothetical protein
LGLPMAKRKARASVVEPTIHPDHDELEVTIRRSVEGAVAKIMEDYRAKVAELAEAVERTRR